MKKYPNITYVYSCTALHEVTILDNQDLDHREKQPVIQIGFNSKHAE